MAFRVSAVVAQDAFATIMRQGKATRDYMLQRKTQLQQPTCDANLVLSIVEHCKAVLTIFDAQASVPGLAEYARSQFADENYNIAAEYTAMRATLVDLRNTIIALFPKDGSGFLLYQTLSADGTIGIRTFTAAQMAGVVTKLDAVINSIA